MAESVSVAVSVDMFPDAFIRYVLDEGGARYHFELDGGDPEWVEAGETALLGRPISAEEIREIQASLS